VRGTNVHEYAVPQILLFFDIERDDGIELLLIEPVKQYEYLLRAPPIIDLVSMSEIKTKNSVARNGIAYVSDANAAAFGKGVASFGKKGT